MPVTLYDSGDKDKKKTGKLESSILEGTVVNNCDIAMQGKVLVRIPSLDQEVWARLSGPGGGANGGFFFTPNPDTEVLVGFSGNDPSSAYILNGLWNTEDSPPISTPLDVSTKRVIKTGIAGGVGPSVEFDDGLGQSITIVTSTKQTIKLDSNQIQISAALGALSIKLDISSLTVSIVAPKIQIGDSTTTNLTLSGASIQIGNASTAATSIQGNQVMIN